MPRTADQIRAEIGTDGNRQNWTMPTPHRLDELPEGACPACGGIGHVWLVNKYRCRECAGTGSRWALPVPEDFETVPQREIA